ncbi:endonuclease NucS domain-containing protein [Sorangium sp. So ce204]|uniref:endonuclease NucS domain-containing protein n=1 Tax=Sorangium sp. So ce204 TaxID=3133288 RepID=UPI003F60129D
MREEHIRDSLATRLDLLEPGLTVSERDREVQLSSPHGAGGRLDILARDSSNNLVVIEVKRSDQSARQAVHELIKYTYLLRVSLGVPQHRIRCFLVSTVWHELLVPFSELARIGDYEICGFEIDVSPDGQVLKAKQVPPLSEEPAELEFDSEHELFLFESERHRTEFISALLPKLETYEFVEFVALVVDHNQRRHGIFPFGLYLVMTALSDEMEEQVLESLDPDHPIHAPDAYADGPWRLADALAEEIRRHLRGKYADWERGTPSKSIEILNEWQVSRTIRVGRRVANDVVFTDVDIHRRIMDIDGDNRFSFQFSGSPRHARSWEHAIDSLRCFLGRRSAWTEPLLQYLGAVASKRHNATISLYIFNPLNIIPAIHPVLRENGADPPFLELFVVDGSYVASVHGILEWSGAPMTVAPAEAFREPGIINVFAPREMEYQVDLARHHLAESLLEFVGAPPTSVRRLAVVKGKLRLRPLTAPVRGLDDFVRENATYTMQLARDMRVMLLSPRKGAENS